MTDEFNTNELNNIGKVYIIKNKIDNIRGTTDESNEQNAKMKLMMFMDTLNQKLQKYDSPNTDFVRSIKTTQQVYTNRSKQLFQEGHHDKQNIKLQKNNVTAIDQFRRQILNLGKLSTTGLNWTSINHKTGLPADNSKKNIDQAYNAQWLLFATNYAHPEFEEDHKAALNSTLNDPGDFDNDGNTLNPIGSAQELTDELSSTPQDLNHDGVLDKRDVDLADGFIDHPENFSQEELAGLTDHISQDVLEELIHSTDTSDFTEPVEDWNMSY